MHFFSNPLHFGFDELLNNNIKLNNKSLFEFDYLIELLTPYKLDQFISKFIEFNITENKFILLNDMDLKRMGIKKGPRVVLHYLINEKKSELKSNLFS